MIDGNDVQALNVKWLRSQIGIVSQEPELFDLSIAENITFGDTTGNVTDEDIKRAAESANIHQFISNLPKVILFALTNLHTRKHTHIHSHTESHPNSLNLH